MAKKPEKTTVTGPRRVLRPRNEAARALRETVYRPRGALRSARRSKTFGSKASMPQKLLGANTRLRIITVKSTGWGTSRS